MDDHNKLQFTRHCARKYKNGRNSSHAGDLFRQIQKQARHKTN